MAGILFIISAPSGSGKSTLVAQVRSLVEGLDFSVSYTTRAPRGSETHGREYHFTDRETFRGMVERGEFLEWAEVFGNYYGTALSALEHARAAGKDLLLDIDVQGAKQMMQKMPEAVSMFILPPSPEVLEIRLRNRSEAEHVNDEEVIERRLQRGARRSEAGVGLQVRAGERRARPGDGGDARDCAARARRERWRDGDGGGCRTGRGRRGCWRR